MSQQNAKKYIDLLLSDKALQERTTGMKPEEVLACAASRPAPLFLSGLKSTLSGHIQTGGNDG